MNPSDVIVVGCNCWPVGGSFSVSDTAGLAFSARTSQINIGGGQFIQTWYAIAPGPLSSDVISVKTPLTGETWYGVIAFGVSGANTASPFDPNPLLPRAQANIACLNNYPCNTGVSTTNPDDFVFQFGGDTGYGPQTAGAGMTLIQYSPAGQNTYAQYERVSSQLSSATLAFGTSQGAAVGVIADAIQPGASSSESQRHDRRTQSSHGVHIQHQHVHSHHQGYEQFSKHTHGPGELERWRSRRKLWRVASMHLDSIRPILRRVLDSVHGALDHGFPNNHGKLLGRF